MAFHVCDGCGRTVDEAHVRERILRLEAATRFRPLHIATLLLAPAPPANPADDFYWLETGDAISAGALFFQQQLLLAAGVSSAAENHAKALSEFQRAGFYLAYVCECPLSAGTTVAEAFGENAATDLARTLAVRVQFSYKPKRVVLLGRELSGVHTRLRETTLASLLSGVEPLPLPAENDPGSLTGFQRGMAEAVQAAAAKGASE